jgi:capsular exopolysaccharide synthesis family protein
MAAAPELRDGDRISTESRDLLDLSDLHSSEPLDLCTNRLCPLLTDPDHQSIVEYFSVLRTRVLNARAKSGLCSVLVASAQKQEGKSLISMNLAISLSQLERDRILLVDGDLRMKGITQTLGLQEETGLADFLNGKANFEGCIRKTTLPYLHISPAGNVQEELLPAILEGPQWPDFLNRAKHDFDMIIVDSVPVSAPIVDFELLLASCDSALQVIKLRKTTWSALDTTLKRLNGKLLGLVVNNAEPPADLDRYYRSRGQH